MEFKREKKDCILNFPQTSTCQCPSLPQQQARLLCATYCTVLIAFNIKTLTHLLLHVIFPPLCLRQSSMCFWGSLSIAGCGCDSIAGFSQATRCITCPFCPPVRESEVWNHEAPEVHTEWERFPSTTELHGTLQRWASPAGQRRWSWMRWWWRWPELKRSRVVEPWRKKSTWQHYRWTADLHTAAAEGCEASHRRRVPSSRSARTHTSPSGSPLPETA